MIGVCMRQQDRVERRQSVQCDPWRTDPGKEPAESRVEVRIRKNPRTCDLQQQGRVPDVGDLQRILAAVER
jgi:hypothetical protein